MEPEAGVSTRICGWLLIALAVRAISSRRFLDSQMPAPEMGDSLLAEPWVGAPGWHAAAQRVEE
jgi:hypothetical protein